MPTYRPVLIVVSVISWTQRMLTVMNQMKISDISVEPLTNSRYIRPFRMKFKQNGIERSWDIIEAHNAVSVLLYHVTKKAFILVKQFRAAVYVSCLPELTNQKILAKMDLSNNDVDPSVGISIELCGGIVDKDLPLVEIMREEIEEECGYAVSTDKIVKITSFRHGVGISGVLHTLYYAEVDGSMKVSEGGGNAAEGEYIEVVYVPAEEAFDLILDESTVRTPPLMFALSWFQQNKWPAFK